MLIAEARVPSNTNSILTSERSFGASVSDALFSTTQKIKTLLISPIGQIITGFGLGLGLHKIYGPLTGRIMNALGFSGAGQDPFSSPSLGLKILLAPFICILGPYLEEKTFRGDLQGALKDGLNGFYSNLGFSDSSAKLASRITSVFFSSILFGLIHFTNALVFWCNPILFLPQVIATTIMGLLFGLAKELTGDLYMPVGMHIGNNTLAWGKLITESI